MVNEANGMLSEGSKAQNSSLKNLQAIAGKGDRKSKMPPNHLLFMLYTGDKLNITLILQRLSENSVCTITPMRSCLFLSSLLIPSKCI